MWMLTRYSEAFRQHRSVIPSTLLHLSCSILYFHIQVRYFLPVTLIWENKYFLAAYQPDIERPLLSENVEYFRSSRLYSSQSQQQPKVKFNKHIGPTSKPLAVSTIFKNDPGPVFTAFSPVQTPKDFPHPPLRSFDHQTSFSKVHPQRKGFEPRSRQGNEDTPPYEFKYDVSDASYGTSFNVQVTLGKEVSISDNLS